MAYEGKTLTEGLAGVKTLKKRILDLQQEVLRHLVRDDRLKDPLEAQGGGKTYVAQKLQAIKDLETELVALLARISATNAKTPATVGSETKPISNWLIERREVYPQRQKFMAQIHQAIAQARQTVESPRYQAQAGEPIKVVVNLDEKAFAQSVEQFTTTQGDLDGQLSLKNATTPIVT